jgi:RimJ/RimL family protein N-acetyltransferase
LSSVGSQYAAHTVAGSIPAAAGAARTLDLADISPGQSGPKEISKSIDVRHAAGVVLRGARLSDLPALVDLQQIGSVRALAHIFPQDTHPFPRATVLTRWARELADPEIEVYVVEPDDRIAGFAAIRGPELLHFGTAVETWGSGLARAAHDEVVARIAATGAARARLRVFAENGRARRFYAKQGWHRTGRITRTSFPPHPVLLEYELLL